MNTQPIRFPCSHCGVRIKAPAPLSGKTKLCPQCGQKLTVPHLAGNNSHMVLEESKDFLALRMKPKAVRKDSDTQLIRPGKLGVPTETK